MFCGSLVYTIYVGANVGVSPIILYFASSLLGFGAASLWVAQQVFIQDCSNDYERRHNLAINSRLGYFNGIFFMGFMFNRFIGNIIVAIVFHLQQSTSFMYTMLAFMCLAGSFGFCFLQLSGPKNQKKEKTLSLHEQTKSKKQKKEKKNEKTNKTKTKTKQKQINQPAHFFVNTKKNKRSFHNEYSLVATQESDVGDNRTNMINDIEKHNNDDDDMNISTLSKINSNKNCVDSVRASIRDTILIWREKNFYYLILLTIYSGTTTEFASGEFPVFMVNKEFKFFSLAIYGLICGICSITFGKMSDNPKYGRIFILYIAAIAHGLFYLICYLSTDLLFNYQDDMEHWIFFVFESILLGIGDAGMLGQLAAIYPCLLGKVCICA